MNNFQLASIEQWSWALSYVRDVPGLRPRRDICSFNVSFIFFAKFVYKIFSIL